jgi:hypothetical protein
MTREIRSVRILTSIRFTVSYIPQVLHLDEILAPEIRLAGVAQSVQKLGYRIDVFEIMLRLLARTWVVSVL